MRIDSQKIKRILIYRCGTIGDTIVSVPSINLLRSHFPHSEMSLMTATGNDGRIWSDMILREFGWFANFITYKSTDLSNPIKLLSIIKKVRRLKIDLVVYLASDKNSALKIWRDRLFFLLGGVKRFIPIYSAKVTWCGHLKRNDQPYPNEVIRLTEGLRCIGIKNRSVSFNLPITEGQIRKVSGLLEAAGLENERAMVAMCPWSKQQAKRWPIERFAGLGKHLIEELNTNIIIVGGQDEAVVGQQIADSWPKTRWSILAGKLSILETAEALRRCGFYVGNDTGAMHLAAAVETPCVTIFSAKDPPKSWHPYGSSHVVLRKQVACRNCYLTECYENRLRCLDEISLDEVYKECKKMNTNLNLNQADYR